MPPPPHCETISQLAHLEEDLEDADEVTGELVLSLDGLDHPGLPWDSLQGRLQSLVDRGLQKVVLQGDDCGAPPQPTPAHPAVWNGLWQSLAGIHPCIHSIELKGLMLPPCTTQKQVRVRHMVLEGVPSDLLRLEELVSPAELEILDLGGSLKLLESIVPPPMEIDDTGARWNRLQELHLTMGAGDCGCPQSMVVTLPAGLRRLYLRVKRDDDNDTWSSGPKEWWMPPECSVHVSFPHGPLPTSVCGDTLLGPLLGCCRREVHATFHDTEPIPPGILEALLQATAVHRPQLMVVQPPMMMVGQEQPRLVVQRM